MKVFIVEPRMTMAKADYANQFNAEVIQQLMQYGIECYLLNDKNIPRKKLELTKDSIILIYNEHCIDKEGKGELQAFLKKAVECDALICPLALDRETRAPMGIISDKQSYDIWEQLRCRDLDEKYLTTVARIFSRKIIARVYPTCYCEKGEIFLSHRRIDGEEITAEIYDKILVQAREATPFRDVVDVKVGEAAQKVIDKVMENSDVFVFIHTPESGKSDWILKELRFALLRNIPILWVQIDDADINDLKMKPSEEPHLKYSTEDFSDNEKLVVIVDKILEKAFELIMERANQMLGYIEYIESMFGNRLTTIDQQKMIYHISMARKGYHYPQRNIEQYYQIFGRTPTVDDAKNLKGELKDVEADSIAILTNRVVSGSVRENVFFDNIHDFCYHWDRYITREKKRAKRMEIVISGAFPDSDEILKQSLTDALILFSKVIIQSGYDITFGSHPTFQELFYEVAKEVETSDCRAEVNMYISEWFLEKEPEKEKEYNQKYNLHVTNKKSNLRLSLSEMRKNMIQREEVKAVVCLGGKMKENKKEEGIREEIELARECNIPVFVVGSVGGCSSEVALEYRKNGWDKLNNAPNEINQNFLEGIDYYSMAKKMIRYISSKEVLKGI
ncbi:MAG: TIR domain-containing protein [Lachnospiraceae bacterium]|nr:TIR domain-containing protein [Lachnospiraceae bacterium]